MNQNTAMPSLLPYLEPHNAKLRIDFTYSPHETPESAEKSYSFKTLSHASPLTRLIEAHIRTATGSSVEPVFLLVQKDTYRIQSHELRPLTNSDMEACWQEAHALYSNSSSKGSPGQRAIFLEKTAADGNRHAFQSLFYCHHRRTFFHPPCPVCGHSLALCRDDHLLSEQGLSAYTSSLRRYLHCPSCPPGGGGNGFYVCNHDPSDTAGVLDSNGLILSWRGLLAGGAPAHGFPCVDCPEQDNCHGAGHLSTSRITPFSFYPFHMLMFRAMTVNAADFLPLLSGGGFEAVENRLRGTNEPARLAQVETLKRRTGAGQLFLFESDNRHFLEILYLKLSLLNDITQTMLAGPAPLDMHAALDCLWVNMPDQGSLLPGLWNFKAGFMDIGLPGLKSAGHPAQITHFLGLAWFHILLTNASQPTRTVITALSEQLEQQTASPGETPLFSGNAFFAPENIFWEPATRRVEIPPGWNHHWESTLGLGWRLLTAGRPGAVEWPPVDIRRDMSVIMDDVKKQLFTSGPAPALDVVDRADDPAIHHILTHIIHKETVDAEPAQATPSATDEMPDQTGAQPREKTDESYQETLILDRGSAGEVSPPEPIGVLAETIIQSRHSAGAPPPETGTPIGQPVTATPRPQPDDGIAETIIQSRRTPGAPPPDSGATTGQPATVTTQPKPDDGLAETIIQSRRTPGAPPPDSGATTGQPATVTTQPKPDDGLAETIIQSRRTPGAPPPDSGATTGQPATVTTQPKPDDGLAETIIQSRRTPGAPPPDSGATTGQPATVTTQPKPDDALAETIVQSRRTPGAPPPDSGTPTGQPMPVTPQPKPDDALAETIVQSRRTPGAPPPDSGATTGQPVPVPPQPKPDDGLAETIVQSRHTTEAPPQPPSRGSDDLPETVILSTAARAGTPPPTPPVEDKQDPADEDDILSETVILRPPQKKNQGKSP